MENDPNKKESKGKRILKKALRRSSKSSSGSSQNEHAVIGSKSFDKKNVGIKIKDSAPNITGTARDCKTEDITLSDVQAKKTVDIQEKNNVIHDAKESVTRPGINHNSGSHSELASTKKNLKRKVDEDGGAGTSGASTGNSDDDEKDPKDKKKKNRCAVCRKKVGLTGFECRCGGLFCAVHRYSDKHECSFDYRELGAQEIRRNNPVVVSQKIDKI